MCFLATAGDFIVMGIAGSIYPGYRMLHDTESMLGASNSPVSALVSTWWVILGVMFIIFGYGFRNLYKEPAALTKAASLLIILYGVGEGMGSGFFHADYVNGNLTLAGKIHDTLGGLGIAGMFILPLLIRKVIPRRQHPLLYSMTWPIIVAGGILLLLFSIAKLKDHPVEIITLWKGTWQRLLTLNFYVYLDLLAITMLMDLRQKFPH